MGRPPKYTPEAAERIVQATSMGATRALAAAYAGIAEGTLYEWMNRYPELRDRINTAEGAAAVGWLAKIERAASEGTWQAAAWKLERRYPHAYGRTVQDVNHGGQPDNPTPIVIIKRDEG